VGLASRLLERRGEVAEGVMRQPAFRWLVIVGAAVGILFMPFASSSSAQHHGRVGVFVGVGPGFWWGPPYPYWAGLPYPYWGVPYPYWYPPYYYAPPGVMAQPQVYVQQAPAASGEWYYCQSAHGYYPEVQSCPEPWVRVPPRSP